MKHVSHIVKTTVVAAAIMAIGSPSFAALIEEEFDAYPGSTFTYENFGGGAINTYSQDTGSVLSGVNSLKLDITNSGTDWWALQVRAPVTVAAGDVLEVSFQIKSTAELGFWSRIEGDAGIVPGGSMNEWVAVAAGETKTVTYQMAPMVGTGGALYMLALGNSTPGAAEVWVDNIQVTVIPEPATLGLLGLAAAVLIGMRRFRN